jgi:hypothetical protein
MTYNPNTPLPQEIPAESQSRFLDNFTLLNQYFGRDHVPFGNVISNATLAAPCVITSASHGLSTGNTVTIYDISGLQGNSAVQWPIDGSSVTITVIDADTFSLNASDSTLYPPYIDGTGNFSSPSYLYGYHTHITYPTPLKADPPITTSGGSSLYQKVFIPPPGKQPSRRGDLFFETQISPSIVDQLTRLFVNTQSSSAGTNYSIVTPWGVIFNFGKTSHEEFTGPITVNFKSPYTATNFGVIISLSSGIFGDAELGVNSTSLTNFSFTSRNESEFSDFNEAINYISIGI